MKTYFSLLRSFYKRMKVQNVVTTLLFIIAVITLNTALTFYFTTIKAPNHLTKTYYEYRSINLSEVQKVSSNNELITINQYKRPKLDTLLNISDKIGHFLIKPDYTVLLNESILKLFDEEVTIPQIVVHNKSNEIGINETFFTRLNNKFRIDENNIVLNFQLDYLLNISDEQQYAVKINHNLEVNFIYNEINYFSVEKLYLPQNLVDALLGTYNLDTNVSIANLLYNLPRDHALTNRNFRLHFGDDLTYLNFLNVVEQFNVDGGFYEISGDYFEKGVLFSSLFVYLRLLVVAFLVLVLIGVFLILVVLTSSFIENNKPQLAVFELFNEKTRLGQRMFYFIYFFNLSFSLLSYPCSLFLVKVLNYLIFTSLGVQNFLVLNTSLCLLNFSLVSLLSYLLLVVVTKIKLSKPLLTTLLALD